MSRFDELDSLQIALNLIEGIHDAQLDVKAYRTHCQNIKECAQRIQLLLRKAQRDVNEEVMYSDEAREVLRPLIRTLQEAVDMLRKCATITNLDKLMRGSAMKTRLQSLHGSLLKLADEVNALIDFATPTGSPQEVWHKYPPAPPNNKAKLQRSLAFSEETLSRKVSTSVHPAPYIAPRGRDSNPFDPPQDDAGHAGNGDQHHWVAFE